jgi:hypothetical protein
MSITRSEKLTQFKNICEEMYLLSSAFLNSRKKERKSNNRFFNKISDEEKIADDLLEVIGNTIFSMSFPELSLYSQINFLKKLNSLHKKLIFLVLNDLNKKQKINKEYKKFLTAFSASLKRLAKVLFPHNTGINLTYLTYYILCAETGLDIPSNYYLLKTEALGVLNYYLNKSQDNDMKTFILPIKEAIESDEKSLNLRAKNISQKFLNILKFINVLRYFLINVEEASLLPCITEVLDRALGIIRPYASRVFAVQTMLISKLRDPIKKILEDLERRVIANDSSYKPSMVAPKNLESSKEAGDFSSKRIYN